MGTLKLLRDATSMMMHAAPRQLDVTEVREFLASTPAVENVLDLHVWSVSTSDVLLTTRLSCPGTSAEEQDGLLSELHAGLHEQFGIHHATIEIVVGKVPNASCALD